MLEPQGLQLAQESPNQDGDPWVAAWNGSDHPTAGAEMSLGECSVIGVRGG